ncbi:hypothetical protein M3Y95_00276800 [Aphelenchoides besseyi]|nr:hypothetical protein M3Y95_00276800 [Aphelenchoides besseyi]
MSIQNEPATYISSIDFDINSRPQPKRKCKCGQKPIWTNELHGLAQLLKAKTWYEKVFWSLVIGICLLLALWISNILFSDFLRQQTVTLNEYEHRAKLAFPNIVICPKNADALKHEKIRQDMLLYLPNVTEDEYYDYLNYVVAGSGVHGMQKFIREWKANYTVYIGEQVRIWRGNRTWEEFFRFIFDENGYDCEDLFSSCFYGFYQIPCCDIFKKNYVLWRGHCFRLGDFFQSDAGDLGKLQLNLKLFTFLVQQSEYSFQRINSNLEILHMFVKQLPTSALTYDPIKHLIFVQSSNLEMPTNYFGRNSSQPQLIVYISTPEGDVNLSPRLYMSRGTWNEFRFGMKYIKMLPESGQQCSSSTENLGVPRCTTNAMLRQLFIEPNNCTLFPFHGARTSFLKTCDPAILIQNYDWIMKSHVSTTHCRPACSRFAIREQIFTSPARDPTNIYTTPFMIQFQYNDLVIEKYTEFIYTSIPGFVSELGGQAMLFLGISLHTVIQLVFLVLQWIKKQICRLTYKRRVYA